MYSIYISESFYQLYIWDFRERSKSLPQSCGESSGVTCSNNDLRSLLSAKEEQTPQRRKSLALFYKGFEVCGFQQVTPPTVSISALKMVFARGISSHFRVDFGLNLGIFKGLFVVHF